MLHYVLPRAAAAALAALCLVSSAQACTRKAVSGTSISVDAGRLDVALADRAILAELNYHRCKAGLPSLKASANLRSVAKTHADWMARTGTLSHKSRVAGQTNLSSRLKSSCVRFRAGSENIGLVHRFQIDGQRFRIRDASTCAFATGSGTPIGTHSYASLARHAVNLWMASSGHRRNILDRKVTMVGSAAAVDTSAPYCGQVYLSQNFAG